MKQAEELMNRVVRENAKQGVNLVVSDSYSPHSWRDIGLYADERVRSAADRQERSLKTSGVTQQISECEVVLGTPNTVSILHPCI